MNLEEVTELYTKTLLKVYSSNDCWFDIYYLWGYKESLKNLKLELDDYLGKFGYKDTTFVDKFSMGWLDAEGDKNDSE